jgi:nicotinamidase-related amidase
MNDRVYSETEVLALARQAYRTGRATFEVVAERCALILIDMQDEFVKPGWTPYWVPAATRMVPRVAALIARCREVGVPVIYTAFAATHHRLDRPRSGTCMPNRYPGDGENDEWFRDGRIWHELAPHGDDLVIFKPSYGAFYDTPLETILRNLDRDTIIIAGTLTNFCCGTTARQGYERGFNVVFGSDITATDDPDLQDAELSVLRKGFARVMTAREIASSLRPPGNDAQSIGHAGCAQDPH